MKAKNTLLLGALLVGLVFGLIAPAQTPIAHPNSFTKSVDFGKLAAVPTSLTCIIGVSTSCATTIKATPYVCGYSFQASGQTITLEDGQATPAALLNAALSGTAGVGLSPSACIPFAAGVYWQASGSGAVGNVIVSWNP